MSPNSLGLSSPPHLCLMNQVHWRDMRVAIPFFSRHMWLSDTRSDLLACFLELMHTERLLALGLVETHARALDLLAFMSSHRLLLSLTGNTWPIVNVWVGLPLRHRAIKLVVYQLVASDRKVLYRDVFSFIVGKKTRLLVIHSIWDCLSQLCWALVFIHLGLCLPFFPCAFIIL